MTESYTAHTLTPVRKLIAARTSEAKQTIPHFRLVADIEATALLELRKRMQDEVPASACTLNDFIIKAVSNALLLVPAVNVQWVDGEIRHFHATDISVVMSGKNGLVTPIVQRANEKTVSVISREVKVLGSRAAGGLLKLSEITGGSFTVSNLGMYGVDQFDAIINPPQCAILAVGAARSKVVVANDGGFRAASLLRATLSLDHRAIDGITGAAFMAALRNQIEDPVRLFEGREP